MLAPPPDLIRGALDSDGSEALAYLRRYWDHPGWTETWKELFAKAGKGSELRYGMLEALLRSEGDSEVERALYRREELALAWFGQPHDPEEDRVLEEWLSEFLDVCHVTSHHGERLLSGLEHWHRPFPNSILEYVLDALDRAVKGRLRLLGESAERALRYQPIGLREAELLFAACADLPPVGWDLLRYHLPSDDVTDVVLAGLASESDAVRQVAVRILGYRMDRPDVRRALLATLDDPAEHVSEVCMIVVSAELHDPEVWSAVREARARGRARGFGSDMVPALHSRREELLHILLAPTADEAYARLTALAQDCPEARVLLTYEYRRCAVGVALSKHASSWQLTTALLTALDSACDELRPALYWALSGHVEDPRVTEAFLSRIEAGDEVAARHLEFCGSWMHVIEGLCALTRHASPDVRRMSLETLGTLTASPEAGIQALTDADEGVRREAWEWLGMWLDRHSVRDAMIRAYRQGLVPRPDLEVLADYLGEESVDELFREGFEVGDTEALRGLVLGLGEATARDSQTCARILGASTPLVALERSASSGDAKVRAAAMESLASLRAAGNAASSILVRALDDPEEQVRCGAHAGLVAWLQRMRHSGPDGEGH